VAAAKEVGKLVAERAIEKGIKRVVFDCGGYLYHGRIKALADAAREAGLEFNFLGDRRSSQERRRRIGKQHAILKRKLDAGQYNLKDQVVSINRSPR